MVYLADWRAALKTGKQITDIEWEFSHYGPYVHDVEHVARRVPAFTVSRTRSMFGSAKEIISAADDAPEPSLTKGEKAILDHVIETTQKLYWDGFMKLVYSTYPVVTQSVTTTSIFRSSPTSTRLSGTPARSKGPGGEPNARGAAHGPTRSERMPLAVQPPPRKASPLPIQLRERRGPSKIPTTPASKEASAPDRSKPRSEPPSVKFERGFERIH